MNMILLNTMIIVFPILIYLVFSCYNVLTNKKITKLVFIITVISSLYLSLNFDSFLIEDKNLLILSNIPILICYFKKEGVLGVILSCICILISYYKYDINLYVICIKYLCYFFTYILLYKRKEFKFLFFRLMAVIQGFFISFEYFLNNDSGIDKLLYIIIYTSFIYVITFICLYLFKLADNIMYLHEAINKVEQENKLRDSLFKLTHEIKNPIAVCKGYLDMINLDNRDKSLKYVNIIKSETDRCLNVIADFMEYSKIKINKEVFDMVMLLDEIYESFSLLLKDKKIEFKYDNSYESLYLFGDYDRLKQVFVNVIKNSIESMHAGGIIDMKISLDSSKVYVTINDNGIGMDNDELENVKTMFYTTKKNGTGLGVALSNEIILAHNGEMNYESKKNIGTTCMISLPM